MADDVTEKNLRELAFDTQKYSGAAIANLVNLAAMRVERDGREKIQYKDLTDVSKTVEARHTNIFLPCSECLLCWFCQPLPALFALVTHTSFLAFFLRSCHSLRLAVPALRLYWRLRLLLSTLEADSHAHVKPTQD